MLVLRRTHRASRASRASQPARGKVEELSKNKHPKVCVLWGRSRIGENGKEDVEGSTYVVKSTASECYYHNNNNVTGISVVAEGHEIEEEEEPSAACLSFSVLFW